SNIGRLSNIAELGGVGTHVGLSSNPGAADELIVYNVQELAGTYYVAVSGLTTGTVGSPYTLTAVIGAPVDLYAPLTATVPATFTAPAADPAIHTVIVYSPARLQQFFPGAAAELSALTSTLTSLAGQAGVAGALVNVDAYPELQAAYTVWDAEPANPLAANYVAATLKSLLYTLGAQYPNWEYLVLVGDDRVIPHRRLRDATQLANERTYTTAADAPRVDGALALRYFLSDDYYAGLLPLPFQGREFYLPQVAVGRLVETPAEILGQLTAYLARPSLTPTDALITGYDFLTDEAAQVSQQLTAGGLTQQTLLNDNAWTAAQFGQALFQQLTAPGLLSLNAHFAHDLFLPPVGAPVFASQITTTPNYSGTLAFSLGCHSGLNVPAAVDWAQAFAGQNAAYLGNTGYGYGDSELIAYSEQLLVNFAGQLRDTSAGPQTVGRAVLTAKQLYFNQLPAGAFSSYDEKVLGEFTLYGLPMLGVRLPAAGPAAQPAERVAAAFTNPLPVNLVFTYTAHVSARGRGQYYSLPEPDGGVQVTGGQPLQPRWSQDVSQAGPVSAQGVLLTGGTFTEVAGFDPVIAEILTDTTAGAEPLFPNTASWWPVAPGSLNRFVSLDGRQHERLVVVPGQFQAASTGTPTLGTERLYQNLQVEVYYAPFEATDFTAPAIWEASATPVGGGRVTFEAAVTDDSGSVARVVVLYRPLTSSTWRKAELSYSAATGRASGQVSEVWGAYEFFGQAVDATGNVALALEHGTPFQGAPSLANVYLPLVQR
ncbi:MAG: hypothetical protein KA764_21665, partial [Anaerolineales bacterium]|nr:hypothetical protein [Anaerolineales bacterium]